MKGLLMEKGGPLLKRCLLEKGGPLLKGFLLEKGGPLLKVVVGEPIASNGFVNIDTILWFVLLNLMVLNKFCLQNNQQRKHLA